MREEFESRSINGEIKNKDRDFSDYLDGKLQSIGTWEGNYT